MTLFDVLALISFVVFLLVGIDLILGIVQPDWKPMPWEDDQDGS